ncbi:hypothetical protein K1T73_14070 [Roseovarius sp. SCSIO 43702]|uniref:I78 family peptidase inhibitor n=1 Tax=Roseovarius sp. SCSIO 43702 TaxID=2823043 RepID=UPI001C72DF87|nr:I78 family peptidase inhibitor [Roseovarius sp. SCSIO 43702]QYX56176.1 hypothetical protein K1T73_14070 [Roseovarius sp. SCSIO 43702]
MRSVLLAGAALMALSACQTGEDDSDATGPEQDACGASQYADRIGTDHEQYDFTAPDRPLRIIPPDSAVTLDHRPERLNVDIDEDGKITRIWCG